MKKTLVLIVFWFLSISLYAQKPLIKIIDVNGNERKYNTEDISEIDFVTTNALYSMSIYQGDTTSKFLTANVSSIFFLDSNKMKINLAFLTKTLFIADIDSIKFFARNCTDVKLNTQIWMCRNLDVDHYRNGDLIPEVTDPIEWANLKTGAWCYHRNNSKNGALYGKLYNWYAVNDPRGLAPKGWHVPNEAEWNTLIDYLADRCGQLKSQGTKENGDGLWYAPNNGAANKNDFSAIPAGIRKYDGKFNTIGYDTYFWTSTAYNPDNSQSICLQYNLIEHIVGPALNVYAFSIRCVKD